MASARWPHAGIKKGYVTAYNSFMYRYGCIQNRSIYFKCLMLKFGWIKIFSDIVLGFTKNLFMNKLDF